MTAQAEEAPVLDPVAVERHIEETKNRIARGVRVVSEAEKEARARKRDYDLATAYALKKAEGPEYLRKAQATIDTMPHREASDNAELAFKHAQRQAEALERELFAWQSILNSVRAMYAATGARG